MSSDPETDHIRQVRVGHGANCSSIGSVVDALFATATVGAAMFAAVLAALKTERVTVAASANANANANANQGKPERPAPPEERAD